MTTANTKTAFLFTGQGVSSNEICGYFNFLSSKTASKTKQYLDKLQAALNEINLDAKFEVEKSLNDANDSSWTMTSLVQPVTYLLSVLSYDLWKEKVKMSPDFVMGHSLGAFSALSASGVLDFEDGLRCICARGKFMQEVSATSNRGMCAIIGLDEGKVKEICEVANCVIALMNAPSAFVAGGERSRFFELEKLAMEKGARKIMILPTPGAFHTEAMRGAYNKLKVFLKKNMFHESLIPVVTNLYGQASTSADTLYEDVLESVIHPVNWTVMMKFLRDQGIMNYVECGPGGFLSALARLNDVEKDKITHVKAILE